jgi:hypothetical protein
MLRSVSLPVYGPDKLWVPLMRSKRFRFRGVHKSPNREAYGVFCFAQDII